LPVAVILSRLQHGVQLVNFCNNQCFTS